MNSTLPQITARGSSHLSIEQAGISSYPMLNRHETCHESKFAKNSGPREGIRTPNPQFRFPTTIFIADPQAVCGLDLAFAIKLSLVRRDVSGLYTFLTLVRLGSASPTSYKGRVHRIYVVLLIRFPR